MFYIVFWPEDSTWETSDTTIPGKNRVAFMRFVTSIICQPKISQEESPPRYLSKLCDQIYCLVSDEDAVKISAIEKWNEMQMLGARSATRMFKRKVEKTAEEEETAQAFPGPTVGSLA